MHVKSPDFGESLQICSKWLQMTASAIIITNNNYCWLKIKKGFVNLFIVINRPIWWKYEANWEFTNSPPIERSERGVPPPLGSPAVWHVCVNRYSRSLIWPRSIFFILSVWCWFSYGTLINSNNVILWGVIQICKICIYQWRSLAPKSG